jgi:hypothetical protein
MEPRFSDGINGGCQWGRLGVLDGWMTAVMAVVRMAWRWGGSDEKEG